MATAAPTLSGIAAFRRNRNAGKVSNKPLRAPGNRQDEICAN